MTTLCARRTVFVFLHNDCNHVNTHDKYDYHSNQIDTNMIYSTVAMFDSNFWTLRYELCYRLCGQLFRFA